MLVLSVSSSHEGIPVVAPTLISYPNEPQPTSMSLSPKYFWDAILSNPHLPLWSSFLILSQLAGPSGTPVERR